MNKKFFIKNKMTSQEKIKSFFLRGRANKKAVLIGAIVVFLILLIGFGIFVHWKIQRYSRLNNNGYAKMTRQHKMLAGGAGVFTMPQDAVKSGEIAIVVDDLDGTKNNIQNIATKNGGVVYSTFISYASDNIKNGSIVVQIPSVNFDTTFSDLKKMGKQVVQESIRQIPLRDSIVTYPPQPMAGTSGENVDPTVENLSIAPAPLYQQVIQNKGYIKVVFADYGRNNTAVRTNVANMFGVGYMGQNLRDNKWLVLAIKSIALIVLIALIVIIAKRIIVSLKKIKKSKPAAHTVKQVVKTRKRIIRVKKK
jgi:hypothetical protein